MHNAKLWFCYVIMDWYSNCHRISGIFFKKHLNYWIITNHSVKQYLSQNMISRFLHKKRINTEMLHNKIMYVFDWYVSTWKSEMLNIAFITWWFLTSIKILQFLQTEAFRRKCIKILVLDHVFWFSLIVDICNYKRIL